MTEDITKTNVTLSNSDCSNEAKICLNEGGRLTNFSFNAMEIISDVMSSNYKENFASSILFPFANRVKNGEYVFDNIHYKLNCNEKTKGNALHGLVYNKTFRLIKEEVDSDFASVTLIYNENNGSDGFPFRYSITLKYTLNKIGLFLKVVVKNEDNKPFPFTLGWHPYFKSANLNQSKLIFNSTGKLISDDSGIVIGKEQLLKEMYIVLEGRKFDDAYCVDSDMVKFMTPNYQLQLKSSTSDNFLQVYTPNSNEIIAIEPMTGVSDSFNNNIGKKILNPKEDFHIEWQISITNLKPNKSKLTH